MLADIIMKTAITTHIGEMAMKPMKKMHQLAIIRIYIVQLIKAHIEADTHIIRILSK